MRVVDAGVAWVKNDRNRRLAYLVAAAVAAILIFFPRPYVARAKLLPQDSSSAGLGQIVNSLGGQLSTFANLLTGGKAPNDLYLIIGRSSTVADDVIADLRMAGSDRQFDSANDAKIYLQKKVDVHLLLGGVVEIETETRSSDESLRLTRAYQKAISDRIGQLGRETTRRKSQIVAARFRQAASRVSQTESALDMFRRQNRLASPEVQLGSELSLRTNLQAQLQAKQIELQSLLQSAGPESLALQSARVQIAALQSQLSKTDRPALGPAGPSVSGLSQLQSRYYNLFRDYRFAQALYDVYSRASEQTQVESLVAESASYIQIVEPANLDARRHYNVSAIAALAAIVLMFLFTEWYAPQTGLTLGGGGRPKVSSSEEE